jgi:hypothetical protein
MGCGARIDAQLMFGVTADFHDRGPNENAPNRPLTGITDNQCTTLR